VHFQIPLYTENHVHTTFEANGNIYQYQRRWLGVINDVSTFHSFMK